jgi:hypothetical protein
MELQSAREIIDTLAQGVHPVTGEVMPEDSPYNAPPVIRALFAVSQALAARKPRRDPPPNAGKPWSEQEDRQLGDAFSADADLGRLARDMGRTRFAVESRLVKLGRLAGRGGLPFANGAAA